MLLQCENDVVVEFSKLLFQLWHTQVLLNIADVVLHTLLVLARLLAQQGACLQLFVLLADLETLLHGVKVRLDSFFDQEEHLFLL